MTVDFLGFDYARPPFDDERVRRAVGMAVDWRAIAAVDASRSDPLTSLLPPGIAGSRRARPPAAPRPGAGAC